MADRQHIIPKARSQWSAKKTTTMQSKIDLESRYVWYIPQDKPLEQVLSGRIHSLLPTTPHRHPDNATIHTLL